MKSQNIIKQYGIFILLFIWLIVDIWIRRDNIFSFQNGILFYWSPEYLGFYLLSAILSFQYLILIRTILYQIKKFFPKSAYALLGIILVFWSFIYVSFCGSYNWSVKAMYDRRISRGPYENTNPTGLPKNKLAPCLRVGAVSLQTEGGFDPGTGGHYPTADPHTYPISDRNPHSSPGDP